MIKYILLSNYKLVYTVGAEFEIILNFFRFQVFCSRECSIWVEQ
jgi:hypothetical protein